MAGRVLPLLAELRTLPSVIQLYLMVALVSAIIAVSAVACGFTFSPSTFLMLAGALLILVVTATSVRYLGFERPSTLLHALAIFTFINFAGMFACSVLASTNLPLTDNLLISIDHTMGFYWLPLFEYFYSKPQLYDLSCRIYASLQQQGPALVCCS